MTIALALAAAASWGTADFLAGLAGRRLDSGRTTLLTVPTSAQLVGLAAAAGLLSLAGGSPPGSASLVAALGAGAANGIGVAALYRGLAVGQMAVVAPIAAMVTSLTPVGLGLLAGERPTWLASFGIAAAVLAAVLVARPPRQQGQTAAQARSVAMGALAGIGLAGMLVLLDRVETGGVVWTVTMVKAAGTAVLVLAAALSGGRPDSTLSLRWEIVSVGLLDVFAIGAYQWAAARGLLVVVAVVASLYPVGTVLLARSVLDEKLGRLQALGVVTAAVAVALIALG